MTAPPSHTTVARRPPVQSPKRAKLAITKKPNRVGRIIDEDESTLLDLIDNLLGKGVMLNADLLLALADVDLVYVRLSALLCAADRVRPRLR
ncbi:MAG: gas vesicle protein GvpJ [Vicinamibacterales bacterium]